MPEPGDVVIRIFNGSGQQVVMYREQHNSAGQFSIQLDAWQLGGGLFFYSMESEGFYDVKKMMVLE